MVARMPKGRYSPHHRSLARFDRKFLSGSSKFTYIGSGSIGGKAHGLAHIKGIIESSLMDRFAPDITVEIPPLTVIATDFFDLFIKQNNLEEIAYTEKDGCAYA